MDSIEKFNVNGKEFQFVNESYSTRNGFAHKSKLFINGLYEAEATVGYINRTWECYPFQTVMLKVVRQLADCRQNHIECNYREENNVCRLTKKHKDALGELWSADARLKEYRELAEKISKGA